jgi:hypothetical protein
MASNRGRRPRPIFKASSLPDEQIDASALADVVTVRSDRYRLQRQGSISSTLVIV